MMSAVTPPVPLLLADDNHDFLVSAAACLNTRPQLSSVGAVRSGEEALTLLTDNQQALDWLPSESARAGRSTGTRLCEVRVSTFAEDQIVRHELWLTRIDRRRIYIMSAEIRPFIKARHLQMLDSWETSIRRKLASTWAQRQAH